MPEKESKRKIVIPGEVVITGEDYLPGEGTEKKGKNIIAVRYGLAEEQNKLVKVIPLSGVYIPRRGNVVIGRIIDVTFNGWIIDIGSSGTSFLPVSEYPKYVNTHDLSEILDIGEMIVTKVSAVKRKGIDLTLKGRGLGKLEEGMIIKINSNKVPRVIGKEGSMINLIKEETNCIITVGQNGLIWIKGNKIEDELLAKRAILFVAEKSFIEGLTDQVKNWFEKQKGRSKKEK